MDGFKGRRFLETATEQQDGLQCREDARRWAQLVLEYENEHGLTAEQTAAVLCGEVELSSLVTITW